MNKIKLFLAVAAAAALCTNAFAYPFSVTGHINREDGDTHYIHYNVDATGKIVSVQWHHPSVGRFGPFKVNNVVSGQLIVADIFVYRWNPNNGGFYELKQTILSKVTDGSIFFGGPNGGVGPAGQGVFQLQPATGMSGGVTPGVMPTKNK